MKQVKSFNIQLFILAVTIFFLPLSLFSQTSFDSKKLEIEKMLNERVNQAISVGKISVDSIREHSKKGITIYLSKNFADFPFRENNVKTIYSEINQLLSTDFPNKTFVIVTDGHRIEDLILPEFSTKKRRGEKTFAINVKTPLITKLTSLNKPSKALQNRHIAMWQSHGYYFEQTLDRWEWQRARIFQTVEDLYTQSYVLPYLVPMLENAGAITLLPRERDTQKHEIIVDNDNGIEKTSEYKEKNGNKKWENGELEGFAHLRATYKDFENPFKEGCYRKIESITKGETSTAEWIPNIPTAGNYAVYISYKSSSKSTSGAFYTVYHLGGKSEFKINQKMGGGTWIYLGHFKFAEGKNGQGKVVLSNLTSKKGEIITADAVKFGGGMGNIARKVNDHFTENVPSSQTEIIKEKQIAKNINYQYQTSNYPRYTEAARYWMQWAGIPDSIYSASNGENDYTDDYKSRGMWVNYLAGSSVVNPKKNGLNIPIDLAFAFHTDAGTTLDNTLIGTLGIYFSKTESEKYPMGMSRLISRQLTDYIQTSIVDDIRALYDANWTRRGMWNRSYFEASSPVVPTMLLELLSHQNFADMRYGLDPRFRFNVSRSIYKGMLRFIAAQNHFEYVVQPLPVNSMRAEFIDNETIELRWNPVFDLLESTAKPDRYIVYTRIGDNDFDNGTMVTNNSFQTKISKDKIYSFKVTAINEGGESFPSEIISAAKSSEAKGTVLVVNGFDRISAPDNFDAHESGIAGFLDDFDHGVPYINDYKYIGKQKEFRRKIPWMDDDASGFGDSYANYETMVIAGNTFDYPALHGKSILKAGYSFVSCSDESVEKKEVNLSDYKFVNYILGKEKQTKIGHSEKYPVEFKTFTNEMQQAITDYCLNRGSIFISGAFIGSDLWDNPAAESNDNDRKFATDILKCKWRVGRAAVEGGVKAVSSPFEDFVGDFTYYNQLNPICYVVESPDAIEPADENAATIFRYSENNLSAAIAYKGNYKTCIMGVPFETIKESENRDNLMKMILHFFEKN